MRHPLLQTAIALVAGIFSLNDPTIAQTPTPAVSWLDQEQPANWNRVGGSVPKAPAAATADLQRCKDQIRPASTAFDRAVTGAGWTLFGPIQIFGNTAVVTAMAGADGMCRPLNYQAFVFVNGRFSGTLTPQPVSSRTDGSFVRINVLNASRLSALFSRYAETDALCCPSRTSIVNYEIQPQGSQFVVIPSSSVTTSNNR